MSFIPINAVIDRFDRVLAVDYATNSVKVFETTDLDSEIAVYGNGIFNFNEHGSAMPDIAYLRADMVEVTGESLKAADAENTETEFTFTLANDFINASFLVITDGVETFTFANDELVGNGGGSGTFNELLGTVTLTFNAAPVAEITANYKHYGGDKIFVTDPFNHRVVVFKGNGEYITSFGHFGVGNGELYFPAGIAVNSTQVHVVEVYNHRVSIFNNSTYAFVAHYGLQGHDDDEGLYYPTDIALDLTGVAGAFVTDTGNNRVVYFANSAGTWAEDTTYVVKQFSNNTHTSTRLAVLCMINNVGRTGFHLTDVFHSNIETYDVSWVKGTDAATKGITDGHVILPRGLCISGTTDLVVSDTGNQRLQIVDLS